jgi:CRP/FNR family transcriptional regulator, anaerobic regulatory protein
MYGVDPVGREDIPGFRLPGEVIGAHGFYSGFHRYNAIALSTSVVCLISARRLTEIAVVTPELLPTILRILGGEVFSHAFLTGSFSAEERVAAFLSDFAYRWQDAVQTNDLQLPMSRSEIAIYLRLAMATVSRILSRMGREKIIEVDHHHIHILDQDHLRLLCRNVPFAEHQPR